jgi:hypothetical protein
MAEVRLLGWWFMPKEVGLLAMEFIVFVDRFTDTKARLPLNL